MAMGTTPTNVQYPILIDFTGSGTIAAGMKIKAYNRNNNEMIEADIETSGKGAAETHVAALDGGNFSTAIDNGDIIEIKLEGGGLTYGNTTTTVALSGGGADVSLTATAINTSLASISI